MNRNAILLIAIFLIGAAAIILFLGISFSSEPVMAAQGHTQNLFALIPIALVAATAAAFIIWIWALVDLLTNQAVQGTEKIVWVLVIIFLHFVGAILYFIISPGKRRPFTGGSGGQ